MPTRSFERFADAVTAFKGRVLSDPFRTVRFQLMGLYLLVGAVIFMLFGWVLGSIGVQSIIDVTRYETGEPVEEAYLEYQEDVKQRRLVTVVVFVIATYYLTEFALRPVRRASELQKHFIGIVSHELRTPLAVMKNMSEVALRNPELLTQEKAVAIIRSNLEETDRLTATIQFLLTFSLLRSRKEIPDVADVSLVQAVGRVLSVMDGDAREREVSFVTRFDGTGTVKGNAIALEGLVMNLVKNAVQYTAPGEAVTVSVAREGAATVLSVADTGPGIPAKDLPYVFEPFFRGDHPEGNGFGLGLSIARQVAELHSASLTVKSEPGSGTVFTVTFPG